MNTLPHIGTVELMDLPDQQLQGIAAKIDTGADSSAIWASKVVERDGQLSFVLFDKPSPFYSGTPIVVKKYRRVLIKNSFGHKESRYKVRLNALLGGQSIHADFTLANRANNRYPILIGRKTLQGKFLVDAGQKTTKTSLHILMLSTKRTEVTQKFANSVAANGERLDIHYASYEDLDFDMTPEGNFIGIRESGRDIANFDLVHFKTTARYMDVAAAAARYLEKRGVPFIDEAIKHFPATSKLYQYMLLEKAAIAVPKSVFMLPVPLAASYEQIRKEIGLPFVLKDIHGNKGEHNYLVTDEASFAKACILASEDNIQCIAQEFIPNHGDYRVLVFGKKISLVMHRHRINDETHLNNTSQGARAALTPIEALPPGIQKACLEAAAVLERQVAGVDIVQDAQTGTWYCLEVNDGPQLATGGFMAEKHAAFADYLERKLG